MPFKLEKVSHDIQTIMEEESFNETSKQNTRKVSKMDVL